MNQGLLANGAWGGHSERIEKHMGTTCTPGGGCFILLFDRFNRSISFADLALNPEL